MKKADKFNPGQWLIENKLTNQSKLTEMQIANPIIDPLIKIIKSKIGDLETQMIDGVIHIDFDDIGNFWMNTFEEVFGHEHDYENDEDYNNFSKMQNITRDLLSNNGEIEIEFDH